MGCLSIRVTPQVQAQVAVQPTEQARLRVKGYASDEPALTVEVKVAVQEQAEVSVTPMPQAKLVSTPMPQAKLNIGEVCGISTGDIYVLAGTDGPLRQPDGGYYLLDPRNEQD